MKFQKLEAKVRQIKDQPSSWIGIKSSGLVQGMLVRAFDVETKEYLLQGVVVNVAKKEGSTDEILLHEIFNTGLLHSMVNSKFLWNLFFDSDKEIAKDVYHYCSYFNYMRKLAISNNFVRLDTEPSAI